MLLGFRRPTFVSFSEWDPGAMASTAPTPCHAMPPCCLKRYGEACSRSALASGRDGMGELWVRLRHRSACGPRSTGRHRVLGLRGLVAHSRRPAQCDTRQRHYGLPGRFPASRSLPRTPAPAPTGALNNNANVVPSYLSGCIGGKCGGTGKIASDESFLTRCRLCSGQDRCGRPHGFRIRLHTSASWMVAARAKADPVAFRLKHARRAVDGRRTRCGEGGKLERPSVATTGHRAHWRCERSGISCVLCEGDRRYAAMVAEVDVDQATGRVTVKRLVVALDCGPISNPDGLRNQIEGGALQGMSRALIEEVTWDDRRVTSVDWRTCPARVTVAVPHIESVLINRPDAEASGAGETTITVTAAAIGNAIFDATGARVRQVPFTPARVREHSTPAPEHGGRPWIVAVLRSPTTAPVFGRSECAGGGCESRGQRQSLQLRLRLDASLMLILCSSRIGRSRSLLAVSATRPAVRSV